MSNVGAADGESLAPGELLRQNIDELRALEEKIAHRILGDDRIAEIELLRDVEGALNASASRDDRAELRSLDIVYGTEKKWEWAGSEIADYKTLVRDVAVEAIDDMPGCENMITDFGILAIEFSGSIVLDDEEITKGVIAFQDQTTENGCREIFVERGSQYDFGERLMYGFRRVFSMLDKAAEPEYPLIEILSQPIEDTEFTAEALFAYLKDWKQQYTQMMAMSVEQLIELSMSKREQADED